MFNKDFYPTPTNVIQKMLSHCGKFWGKTILDPSAGKGDILDFIHSKYKNSNLIAFEIEEELRSILFDKPHISVIGKNFLNDLCPYSPDIILMNPPFSQGAKHFLHAYELLKNGVMVCLLNAETINNPSSFEKQKVVQIIKDNDLEVYSLGSCFSSAERKTNVEVAMVVCKKHTEDNFDFDFDFDTEHFTSSDFPEMSNELEVVDYFKSKESLYLSAIEQAKEISNRISYLNKILDTVKASSLYDDNIKNMLWDGKINNFIRELNGSAWDRLLQDSKFGQIMTSKVQDEFNSKFNLQRNVAFTKKNMVEMLHILMQNKTNIMDECLVEVFDYMTKYYDENRCHIEGWKTNDHYKVNKKVILPCIEYCDWSKKYEVRYNYRSNIRDIDRAMCYLTGLKFEDMYSVIDGKRTLVQKGIKTIVDAVAEQGEKIKDGKCTLKQCESTFFKIKFFKKGTIHIVFKDSILWQWFNCKVSELKGHPLPDFTETAKKAAKNNYQGAKEVLMRLG